MLPGRWLTRSQPTVSGNVDELLGGVTLNEEVTVIQGFEVNFDDIGTGVVDPHAVERMGFD